MKERDGYMERGMGRQRQRRSKRTLSSHFFLSMSAPSPDPLNLPPHLCFPPSFITSFLLFLFFLPLFRSPHFFFHLPSFYFTPPFSSLTFFFSLPPHQRVASTLFYQKKIQRFLILSVGKSLVHPRLLVKLTNCC